MRKKLTIKEWEVETGIKVRNPKGFIGKRNKIHTKKYTREAFRLGIQKSEISVKTNKGMDFLTGQAEENYYWDYFIDFTDNKRKENRNATNKDKWNKNRIHSRKRKNIKSTQY